MVSYASYQARQEQFARAAVGYDVVAVKEFRRRVSHALADYELELAELRRQAESLAAPSIVTSNGSTPALIGRNGSTNGSTNGHAVDYGHAVDNGHAQNRDAVDNAERALSAHEFEVKRDRALADLEQELNARSQEANAQIDRLVEQRMSMEASLATLQTKLDSTRIEAEVSAKREVALAREEARRIRAVAEAEATAMLQSVHPSPAEPPLAEAGSDRLVADAKHEASSILEAAVAEASALIDGAESRTASITTEREQEVKRLDRRLAQLRTTVRDVEGRFRGLLGVTLDEFSLVGDLIDLENTALEEIAALQQVAVNNPWARVPGGNGEVTGQRLATAQLLVERSSSQRVAGRTKKTKDGDRVDEIEAASAEVEERFVGVPAMAIPDINRPGFYEKRMAGLRARIKKAESEA